MQQRSARESDEVAMARYPAENPHHVQTEYELFASRDAQGKKAIKKKDKVCPSVIKKEDESGPSAINVEANDEEEEVEVDSETESSWSFGTVSTTGMMMMNSVCVALSLS